MIPIQYLLALVHTQSTGINWGQALAIWVPIVGGMLGITVTILAGIRGFKRWQEERESAAQEAEKKRATQAEQITERLLHGFAQTLNVRFTTIDQHLEKQDERLDRIDRQTGTDSR